MNPEAEELIHLKGAAPTVMVSFPKSGQTLLAAYIEAWTSQLTMSTEGQPKSVLNDSADAGHPCHIRPTFNSVWGRVGHNPNLFTQESLCHDTKFIELVRHPVEVILSYYAGRTGKAHFDIVGELSRGEEEVMTFVRDKMKYRHNRITQVRMAHQGPTAVVPYEVLVNNPLYVLESLTETGFIAPKAISRMWVFRNHQTMASAILGYKRGTKLGSQTSGDGKCTRYWQDLCGDAIVERIMAMSEHPVFDGLDYSG